MHRTLATTKFASLSESKRRLLEQRVRGDLGPSPTNSRKFIVSPRARDEALPVSMAEEQIWLRAQASIGLPPFYNESITVHRKGKLDLALMQESLTRIIQRHEIWRTTFDTLDGRPVRVIRPAPQQVPLPFVDLRGISEERREGEALRLAAEELRRPFDLKAGPLVRFTLVRLEEKYYRLFVAAHQIVMDGVTAYHVFLPELVGLYEGLAKAGPPSLPEVPVQYADYASWQRVWADAHVLAKQLEYWHEQFARGVPDLVWPRKGGSQLCHSFRGKIHSFFLPWELAESVRNLSRRQNTTLFLTLFATFAVLLHCYSGQDELVIGTVTPAGRDHSEVQHAMGYFLNPVGIRSEAPKGARFSQVLQSIREAVLGAFDHDDVPYELVARTVDPNTSARLNPLFTVAASLEPRVPEVASGWDLTPMDVESGGTRWPLYFVWEDRSNGISGRVQYNPDIFTFCMVCSLVEDFRVLLETAVRDPQIRLSELPRFANATVGSQ